MSALGDFYPRRTNQHVPGMSYAADVNHAGYARVSIAALIAADAGGILAAQSIATASSATSFATTLTETALGKFGRNVTVVASGAATSTVTVTGRDYLGQIMKETLTLNGTTSVPGVKAFRWIDKVEWGATAATTINVGWGNVLGLPYKSIKMDSEVVSGVAASSAGAIVAGLASSTTPTATNADTRGTYAPHLSNVPDGSKTYELVLLCDRTNLYGNVQYSG